MWVGVSKSILTPLNVCSSQVVLSYEAVIFWWMIWEVGAHSESFICLFSLSYFKSPEYIFEYFTHNTVFMRPANVRQYVQCDWLLQNHYSHFDLNLKFKSDWYLREN
jgi:hypothetical protein